MVVTQSLALDDASSGVLGMEADGQKAAIMISGFVCGGNVAIANLHCGV